LKWDPSINDTNIKVSVREGNVTLNGYVPTYAEKRESIEKMEAPIIG